MLTLPQEVQIGPLTYQVREDTRTAVDGVYGTVLYGDCVISLQPGLALPFQEVILWHEMIHAILSQAGLRNQDEQIVHAIAFGVVQAIKSNPALVGAG